MFEEGTQVAHRLFAIDVFERAEFGSLLRTEIGVHLQLRGRIPFEQHVARAGREPVRDQFDGEIERCDVVRRGCDEREEFVVFSLPIRKRHDRRDREADRITGASQRP
jgi:hypothetical protein